MPLTSVRGVDINYAVLGERGPWVLLIQGAEDMEGFGRGEHSSRWLPSSA